MRTLTVVIMMLVDLFGQAFVLMLGLLLVSEHSSLKIAAQYPACLAIVIILFTLLHAVHAKRPDFNDMTTEEFGEAMLSIILPLALGALFMVSLDTVLKYV